MVQVRLRVRGRARRVRRNLMEERKWDLDLERVAFASLLIMVVLDDCELFESEDMD